jgi:hypothetical protein
LFFSTLQVTFPQALSFRGQVADFMMVFVILTGYLFGTLDGAVVGLITGVLRDVLASGPVIFLVSGKDGDMLSTPAIGVGMLLLLYIGIISSILFTKMFHRRLTLGFVQVLLITLAYKIAGHSMYFFIPLITNNDSQYLSFQSIMLDSVLPQLAINLIVSVPMIILLKIAGPYRKGFVRPTDFMNRTAEELWQIR